MAKPTGMSPPRHDAVGKIDQKLGWCTNRGWQMWFGLFLVLIAMPLLELALLIKLGQSIGVLRDLRGASSSARAPG